MKEYRPIIWYGKGVKNLANLRWQREKTEQAARKLNRKYGVRVRVKKIPRVVDFKIMIEQQKTTNFLSSILDQLMINYIKENPNKD